MTVRSNSLADRIAATLRERILSGRIKPEERLSGQNDLAQEFGVSVVVVREAISRLKADGLVRSRQGSGVFAVANPTGARSFKVEDIHALSPAAMAEVFDIRLALESNSARLAALHHRPAELRRCEAAYKKLAARFRNGESTIDADFEFHLSIARASGNTLFPQLLNYLHGVLLDTMLGTVQQTVPVELRKIVDEHAEILDAIKKRDARGADRIMRRHLIGAAARIGLQLGERHR